MALNIRDCVSLCLSPLVPCYLVSMPGEVKYLTHRSVVIHVNVWKRKSQIECEQVGAVGRNAAEC